MKTSNEGGKITIQLPRLFGFAARHEFKSATTGNPVGSKYILDFQLVEKMDSSALGMMLILRETVGGQASDVTIVNPRTDVRNMLLLANFQTLFRMA